MIVYDGPTGQDSDRQSRVAQYPTSAVHRQLAHVFRRKRAQTSALLRPTGPGLLFTCVPIRRTLASICFTMLEGVFVDSVATSISRTGPRRRCQSSWRAQIVSQTSIPRAFIILVTSAPSCTQGGTHHSHGRQGLGVRRCGGRARRRPRCSRNAVVSSRADKSGR